MLNNHNIILLFSDFYNILSFLIDLIDGFKTFLDPDRDFLAGSGSGFDEYGSETLEVVQTTVRNE